MQAPTNSTIIGRTEHTCISRKEIGLIATIEDSNLSLEPKKIPEPFPATCLQLKKSDKQDSLLKLAKHAFHKLSQKQDARWTPTAIQLQSWSILNNNLNLIAIATTGSGKTLSYALPMVDSCMRRMEEEEKSTRRVHGLVLVPTRELAIQVSKVLKVVSKSGNKLSGEKNIVALAIYGGVDKEEQIDSLINRTPGIVSQFILAATPMRLIDLIGIGDERKTNEKIRALFETTKYLVIDEADRMATQSDMSEQVEAILDFVRANSTVLDRQCLFSATLPNRAISKCNEWIDMPRVTVKFDTVTVGGDAGANIDITAQKSTTQEGSMDHEKQEKSVAKGISDRRGPLDLSTIPAHIKQTLHVCATHKKPKKLCHTIKKIRDGEQAEGNRRRKGLIIIYFARIKTLQLTHQLLLKEGMKCVPFHSKIMNQKQREMNLNYFRCGKTPILLATDIAARGLHFSNVEYIINYDFPGSLEQVSL